MCQDTVKIREEDDLEKDSMENVLKQPMVRFIRKIINELLTVTVVSLDGKILNGLGCVCLYND